MLVCRGSLRTVSGHGAHKEAGAVETHPSQYDSEPMMPPRPIGPADTGVEARPASISPAGTASGTLETMVSEEGDAWVTVHWWGSIFRLGAPRSDVNAV